VSKEKHRRRNQFVVRGITKVKVKLEEERRVRVKKWLRERMMRMIRMKKTTMKIRMIKWMRSRLIVCYWRRMNKRRKSIRLNK